MVESLWVQFSSPLFLILVSTLGLLFTIKQFPFTSKRHSPKNPPPSPKGLPIIGNLHQLSLPLHRALFSLSRKYGPLMLLHLGSIPVLVVSSAEAAHEIMKTHDLVFCSRREFKTARKLLYNGKDIAIAPYGKYWRQMRGIFAVHLLSNKKVRASSVLREERTAKFMNKIVKASQTEFNMSEFLASITFDMVCKVAFGKTKELEGEKGERFKKLLEEVMLILGEFNLEDVLPWLSLVSRVNGRDSYIDKLAKDVDEFLEDMLQEHINRNKDRIIMNFNEEDFVDILLKIQKDGKSIVPIDRDGVKAIVLDVFAGGVNTTSTLLEWEMSELLKHPSVMKQLQDEVRGIADGKPNITSEDLEKMSYLKAVAKETLRLHPPVPLPVPREARYDAKVMSYDVDAKTMVILNLWAINRDPKAWEKPDEFQPDRFLDSSVDFKGNDYHFVPFGGGRKGCPGISFAAAMNEVVLANLMYKFDWKLPNGMGVEDLDMTESNDFTVHKKTPLFVIATPHPLG